MLIEYVRSMYGRDVLRTHSEHGASMVEYALLVGLIAVVAVVGVVTLEGGISSLFNSANTCLGGVTTTSC